VAVPLGRQRRRAAQPLLERRQPVPRLLGPRQRRRLLGGGRLEGLLALLRGGEVRSTSARRSRSAVSSRTSASSAPAQRSRSSASRPQPGVAQVGLHLRGPAGDLRLAAERLELAAQLGR
jgi:hypothetical protein